MTIHGTEFISVRSAGAKGDGVTDDTAALQAVFNKYWGCKIICTYQDVFCRCPPRRCANASIQLLMLEHISSPTLLKSLRALRSSVNSGLTLLPLGPNSPLPPPHTSQSKLALLVIPLPQRSPISSLPRPAVWLVLLSWSGT